MWCGHVGREASLLSGPGGIPGPCSAPLPVSGLREFRKPDLALAPKARTGDSERVRHGFGHEGVGTQRPRLQNTLRQFLLRF